MPTFHHWRAGKQRNGLTFQTAADARAFDKGILRAYNELIDGMAKANPSIICPPLTKYDSVGEDDVFMVSLLMLPRLVVSSLSFCIGLYLTLTESYSMDFNLFFFFIIFFNFIFRL